jgi:thymidylate synthase (FAD)
MRIVEPCVRLLFITPEGSREIERAARTCYKSEVRFGEGSDVRLVETLKKRGHMAMIEHAYASFRFVTDRGITHEIVRHRIASYAQESTRYCNYSKAKFGREISVIRPSGIEPGTVAEQRWRLCCEASERTYFQLLDEGCKPQVARSVLPTCLKTEIVMTANFREWLHFLYLRAAPTAHPDLQPLARRAGEILIEECPAVFDDYPVKLD